MPTGWWALFFLAKWSLLCYTKWDFMKKENHYGYTVSFGKDAFSGNG